jgi:hypothetical protein
MRWLLACSILAALLVVIVSSPQCYAHRLVPSSRNLSHGDTSFTCEGRCTTVLINAIGLARKSIIVQGYRIGPLPVLSALQQAEAASVHVRMIPERGRTRYPDATVPQGSQVRRDPNYAVDRPEVIVIDNREVIKVFFGLNSDHSRSVASLFVIRDPDLALTYTRQFRRDAPLS